MQKNLLPTVLWKTLLLALFAWLAVCVSTQAASVYWDINGTAAGCGSTTPAGNWGTNTAMWGDSGGTAVTANWVDGDTAVFSAGTDASGPYVITVVTPITVGSIIREEGSPTISATAGNPFTFASGALPVDAGPSPGTLVINAFFAPANGVVTKTGAGILSVGTSQTSFQGKWICNAGTLSFPGDLRIGILPGAPDQITLNGGRIRSSTASVVFDATRGVVLGASGGGFNQLTTTPLTWNGVISGPGSLTLDGASGAITVLGGNNTYGGNTIVTLGTLQLGTSGAIPVTSVVTLASGTTNNLANFNETVASVSGAASSSMVALGTGTLTLANPAGETFQGVISGAGGLVKNGNGTFTFTGSGANIGTWTTTINAGVLCIARSGSGNTTLLGDVTINGGSLSNNVSGTSGDWVADTATVTLNGGNWDLGTRGETVKKIVLKGGTVKTTGSMSTRVLTVTDTSPGIDAQSGGIGDTVNGVNLAGVGSILSKTTAGTVTLVGNSTFNGGVNFSGGTLLFGGTSPFGTGPLTINGSGLVLRSVDANAKTATNAVNLSSDVTLGAPGSGNLTFSAAGPWTVAGPTRVINVDTISATISGVINGGASAIVKNGSGTLALFSAGNSYGSLTVSAGTVAIGNNTAIPPGSSVTLSGGTMALSSFPTASALFFGATQQAKGTWGSTFTSATHKDAQFSGTGIITVTSGGASTISVSSDNNPSTYLSLVNLKATVVGSGSPATPTGTVTFFDSGSPIGTVPVSGGGSTVTAILPISTLSIASHNITATYSGDSNFDTSTSAILVQTVNAAPAAGVEQFQSANLLPPPAGTYISPALWHILFANGIVIKDVSHERFTSNSVPPTVGNSNVDTFNSGLTFQLSMDNGATYTPVSGFASVSVQVTHSYDFGGMEHYDTEMTQLDVSGLPGGIMLRESPTLQSTGKTTIRAVAGGYMIGSYFDVNVEVSTDGGATWLAANNPGHVELRNDPNNAPQVAEPNPLLPPPQDKYVSPAQWHALFAQGIVIKDVSHDLFTQTFLPPTTGSNTEAFNSRVSLQISTDGGATFQSISVSAPVTVSVSAVGSPSSGRYDTEMTSLSLSSLPGGLMIRESPSLPSRGFTKIDAQPDGTYQIHSFFDIFTELSTDGGATWSGATNGPVRMQLTKRSPDVPKPNPNLPPPDGNYVSPAQWHALYANGIILTNISHSKFTQTQPPPPPGGSSQENFGSQVNGLISMDGGASFQPFSAPGSVAVNLQSQPGLESGGTTRVFDTEMTQLDVSGGNLPGGVMVRESPTKASLGRTSIRQDNGTGQYYIASFFDVFTEVSLDGGATWSPQLNNPPSMGLTTNGPNPNPLAITCPSNITVQATSPAGAVVTFAVATSGGCPPINVVANPPSGSTFPVGTTTVSANATDSCGGNAACQFNITVTPPAPPEYFTPYYMLPPPGTVYISPGQSNLVFNNGIVIRDIRQHFFTQNFPPPPLGGNETDSFVAQMDYDISFDNGVTFQRDSRSVNVTVNLTHSSDDFGKQKIDGNLVGSDAFGGGYNYMLRESPSKASLGRTTISPVTGGYMVSSFFDVFTEISLDGGATWTPAQDSCHMELRNDPENAPSVGHPTPLLPPPGGAYVSPQQWHALYAQGIVIKDVSHKFFTTTLQPPPAGGTNFESFNSIVDLSISLDGGNSFQFVRVSAPVTVTVIGQGSSASGFYDTEMTSLQLSGLPSGLMIRESPSLPSRGSTETKVQSDGTYKINSFFDIFTELSTDGGATWSPGTNGPVRMQLTPVATETSEPNPNLPPLDGNYVSPAKWHALYANGIIITNASHNRFTQTQPPPPPGGSQTENFGSTVGGMISMDGGASFQPFSAPASVAVQVNSRPDEDNGSTRFFDTEMLALSLSGGNLPGGVMVRESPSKASLGRTSIRTTSTGYKVDSFFDVFTEVSLDGGATWSPSITAPGTMGLNPPTPPPGVTCPSNITVYATSPAGAVVSFTVGTSGSCPPINVVANPPSGSTFPVGATTVNVTATDNCGQGAQCSFTVTVVPLPPEYFFPQPVLPPVGSVYISPALWHVLYNNGIIIKDVRHRFFTQNYPLPPLGASQTETFGSELDFLLSTDNGATFIPATGTANVTVHVTHSQDANGISSFDTEMLQLDMVTPGGPTGNIMLRESPTLQSTGHTTVRPVAGGYMISSFFDVFTEVSLDNGNSWTPAQQSGHVEMHPDPKQVPAAPVPTPILPPPDGAYVSPQLWHALYAQGVVIKNVSHRLFTTAFQPPAPGTTNIESFNSQIDLDVSVDGGNSYQTVRVPAPAQVTVASHGSSTDTMYDTEMTALNLSLPSGIMVRESPSLPSRGQTEITPQGDGTYRIGSFFDIFTELSLDGGATWAPATNGPVRVQLIPIAPEVPRPNPNLPPQNGNYISPAKWHALYANGIIITNASHNDFTQTYPPPPPGGSQPENFGSQVSGLISLNGGASYQPFSAPASVAVQVNSRADEDNGSTRFFDTEMLALNLSGGNLPGGVMVRESPTKASLGRTSIRTTSSGYAIDSFFDVFTEVSLDGGATWSPSITGPGNMRLTSTNLVTVTCSSNITVTAASCASGAIVNWVSIGTGGCGPVTVTCTPPSGSFFPIGTTTVNCTGCDPCGMCDQCSFTVTVLPPGPCPPLVLTCSTNITVNSSNCGSAGVTVFFNSSATGGCTNPTVVCNPPSGSTFPVGTTTVTCTASDGCGNSTNCSFTVTVNPCPSIVLACSSNIVVNATNCGAGAGATVFYSSSVSGGCGPASFSCSPPSGSFFPIGTTTVTCTAFDCGVVATNCSFTVTVKPPVCPPLVLTCSSNIVVNSTNCGSAGAVVFFTSSATGGCAPTTVNCNPPSGSTFPIGTTLVTCLATDNCGNKTNCSFTVTVNGCPPVVLNCSSNITVNATNCGAGAGANVFFSSSVSGGCGPASFSCNPPSGSFFPIGTTTVTCTAFDCGVVATNCSFTVTVNPPVCPPLVLNCSSNITVNSTNCGSTGAVVFFNSTASGGCAPTTLNCNPPSGSTFPIGTTLVTCTASDACGNHTNCSFTVTVNGCPPIALTCSSNITVNATNCNSTGGGSAVVFFASTVTGGCGPATVSCNPPSGSSFPIGTTTVTCTAFDCGIVVTNCSFTVTVNPPVCPPIVLNCSTNLIVNTASCTNTSTTVFFTSTASGGCAPVTLICNPPSGSTFPLGTSTVTCTATDNCGNHTNCSFTVTVNPPVCPPLVLNCSSNIVVNNTNCGSTSSVVFFISSASGGCGPVILNCTPPSGSTFPIGTTTVNCSASDACGNKTNCSFTVTVNGCPPVALTCSSNITVNATNCNSTGGGSAVVFFTSTVTGGCGPATVSCNPPSGSSFPIGTTTVTCTAFDCGVVVTNCSFTVTVNPPVCPPIVLNCSTNLIVNTASCTNTSTTVFFTSTASGGCGPVTLICNPPSGSTFPLGTSTVTCTATDNCGNHTNCSFTITVKPATCPPIVVNCSSNIVVTNTGCIASNTTVFFNSSATGGCAPLTLTCNPPSGSTLPPGITTVTCSAVDGCGNSNVCSFTVTVTSGGACPPILLTCSTNITINATNCTGTVPVFFSSSATGGCGPVTVSCTPPSGSGFPVNASTLVTCTATDACGNTTNCSFAVTVNAPHCSPIVLTCSTNITINTSCSNNCVPVFFSSSASGGCGPVTVTCNPPSGSCFNANASTLVTCTATDACGNTTNCSFAVTINQTCPPIVLNCSTNITVTTCSNTCVRVFYSSTASGGCGPTTVSCNPPSGSCFPANASTLVTCTATDACGHTTNCTFSVTVNVQTCPPFLTLCIKHITVNATSPFGAFVSWGPQFFGGCPPITTTCSPPSGSFFPVGSTMVTCTGCDACGHCGTCKFIVTVVPKHHIVINTLPATNTVYISPALWHVSYANGVIIRDVRHRFFTQFDPPPPLGTTNIHTFGSQVDFELSQDSGTTWQPISVPANVTASVAHTADSNGVSFFDTEMLSLDISGAPLPPNIRLRESPTLQSLGQTTIEPTPGGYFISSFFDIFTELSLDGGNTWTPADDSASVAMYKDPRTVSPGTQPDDLIPPPNGTYVSPQQWHALFAQGIVISNVAHKFFTQSMHPPSGGGSNTESFSSTVDMQISTDGGNTFQFARVTAPVQVTVNSLGSGNSGMYDTEMTQLDLSGGGLPAGIMIRESPTLPSRGGTQIDQQPDGTFRINSFFDIFVEVSTDNGGTWSPATNGPVRMEFAPQAIEVPSSSSLLPVTNAPYISPAKWHALYANGIIITNVSHSRFTQTQPPPPPGQTQLETFGSTVEGQLSLDGGKTFTSFSAPATAAVQVISRSDQDSGPTRHFDTEMLSLSLSGGNLPGSVMVRESPSKASLGRTSIRTDSDGNYRISSFFDIFTEVSLDNGQSWSPSTTAPATMSPRLPARKRFFPQPNLPPTNGQYISPKQWHALYANGIVISNVTHRRFLANFTPPPKNTTNTHNFGSQVNLLLKMPGQSNFIPVTANADCQVSVGSSGFQSREQVYQTEMLSLNLSGGSLPPGVMIRESPTRRSTGETHYSGGTGNYRISSFFDIFTEISTDGGQTWSPASAPGSMELHIDPGVPPTTVVNPRINNGNPTFTVQSQLGLKYLLQYKDDLLDPTWTTGPISSGTGDQLDLIDCCPPPGPSRPHRFYRIEVQEDDSY
jgi:autotransporter-associated beta strand protein